MSKKRKYPKVWKRSGKTNRHHIVNKCRGGTWASENIIVLDTEIHAAWHFLFNNMSFREVGEMLIYVAEQKENSIDVNFNKQIIVGLEE